MVKPARITGSGWRSKALTISRTSVYLKKKELFEFSQKAQMQECKFLWYDEKKKVEVQLCSSEKLLSSTSSCSAGGLTQVRAPTDGVSLLGLSGSAGGWINTAGGERLRSCQVCTPPTYRSHEDGYQWSISYGAFILQLVQEVCHQLNSLLPSMILVQLDQEVAESLFVAARQSSDDGDDDLWSTHSEATLSVQSIVYTQLHFNVTFPRAWSRSADLLSLSTHCVLHLCRREQCSQVLT